MLNPCVTAFAVCLATALFHPIFAQMARPQTPVAPPGAVAANPGAGSGGTARVVVYLADPPLAKALAAARGSGGASRSVPWSAAAQQAYAGNLRRQQAGVAAAAASLGGRVAAQLTKAANGVVVEIEDSRVADLRRLPGVTAVLPVYDSQKALPAVLQRIGAAAVQAPPLGLDGRGVRVAVLDEGIDFTHYDLGGAGTAAAFEAAYGAPAGAGCRPTVANTTAPQWTSKVVGGFDFVGEAWPDGPLAPDPNPIDCDGHGTHVADILAGRSADGKWKGVAPGAVLYAVKVCSAVSESCSGLALIEGLEFALDPNGDGDLSDAVDVVNLSLGAAYGLRESFDTYAVEVLVDFGVVVVAAAGNDGNAPYIASAPGTAPASIAVAETRMPGELTYPLVVISPAAAAGLYRNTAFQPWSRRPAGDVTGEVVAVGLGCAPADFPAGTAGRLALVRRGGCAASVKSGNATAAGAVGVIVDDNVPAEDPFVFGFGGGGPDFAPTISITMALGNSLRAAIAGGATVVASISVSNTISLAGSLVASSARGPSLSYTSIKPDIGAPGGAVSAVAGTGAGRVPFGGTSGATPVVSGSAALLLQAYPWLTPAEVKARLMNTADTSVVTNPLTGPGVLAPVSRIGAGEVRVDRAVRTGSAMWDAADPNAVSLSFGYQAASAMRFLRKRVVVRNYGGTAKTYAIAPLFRDAGDQAAGAVTLTAPASLTVPANSSSIFTLSMSIDPARLPLWSETGVNGGFNGAAGELLESVEFDGFLTLEAGPERITLPWQVLPRRAHEATAAATAMAAAGEFGVANLRGARTAPFDVFALTGTSPQLPYEALPGPGDSFQAIDLRAVGVRPVLLGSSPLWAGELGVEFAVNTFDLRGHPNTAMIRVNILDAAGQPVWRIVAAPSVGNTSVVYVQPADNSLPPTPFFYTGVDLNSSNVRMLVPLAPVIGGRAYTLGTASAPLRFTVEAIDIAFTGWITDRIGPMVFQLDTPKYRPQFVGGVVPLGAAGAIPFAVAPGGAAASPSQSGFLVLWTDALPGREASVVVVE